MTWRDLAAELEVLNAALLRAVEQRQRSAQSQSLDQLHGLVLHEDEILEFLSSGSAAESTPPAVDGSTRLSVSDQFGLGRAEELCLLLSLACEVDPRYGKTVAFLQDDITRKLPTVGLAIELFWGRERFPEGRAALLAGAPLLRHRLVDLGEISPGCPLSQRQLRLDGRITGLMLGASELDDLLVSWVELWTPGGEDVRTTMPPEIRERTLRLATSCFAEGEAPVRPIFHLHGREGSGRRALAMSVCGRLGLPLLVADVRRLPSGPAAAEALWRLGRESLIQPAAIFLAHFDELLEPARREERDAFLESAGRYSPLTFLAAAAPWNPPFAVKQRFFLDVECPALDVCSRADLWGEQLRDIPNGLGHQDLQLLAGEFDFTGGQIREALLTARARSIWTGQPGVPLAAAEIHASCRQQATPHLGDLARRVQPAGSWDDLVLPEPQKVQLQEIVAQVKRSQVVLGQWGFAGRYPYGLGIAALFEGASGTGKTMAAGIIAAELGLELFKIDLGSVVNKYIGETEKNLSRIFDEARNSNAILFFDEAEALFARRSETVKDANDRFAGIETAHLLQRLEGHNGVVLLASNMKQNLDDAFLRRMRFVIHFPLPGEEERERVWRRVFPPAAPLAADVDFHWLARRLKITAGQIKNIGLRAAFLAADRETDVNMTCILDAARREMEKMGKVSNPADFRLRTASTANAVNEEVA
jgi:hypothetical protein